MPASLLKKNKKGSKVKKKQSGIQYVPSVLRRNSAPSPRAGGKPITITLFTKI